MGSKMLLFEAEITTSQFLIAHVFQERKVVSMK
jgi:hypothetical protein